MSTTAPLESEIVYLNSIWQPGKVCAQMFTDPLESSLDLVGGQIRRFKRMQCSDWHPNKTMALGDLEAKVQMLGFKVAV